ncbi:ATP-dependent DNA helicase [Trichonephila clavipes]|nr:ATP-dependent DNA helicase [Trichonephila clavipes]
MIPSDSTIPFKRLQFPIRLAFVMSINKSQGQTMYICGLDLENPCFSHGQLYVACSRVGKPSNLFVLAKDRKEDLISVLKEIGEQATSKETIIELKTKLEKSAAFKDDPDFVINLLNLSFEDRQAKAEQQLQETNSQLENIP